jgi:hypothetical protein
MSKKAQKKKYVVAIDLDYTALISNDLGGLRGAIDLDALSDADALTLVQHVVNPRLLEAVASLRQRNCVDRLVFYTAKGGLLHGLSPQIDDLWIRPHTLRFRAGLASRRYLCDQLPPSANAQHRADFMGLGALTWGLSCLLGLRTLSAPVYITREGKDPAIIAHDLAVPHVVLFDDQAETYAAHLPPPIADTHIMRAVEPFDYECLTPPQAQALEAFLLARCGPPLADCDVSAGQTWRIVARARGQPLPPWLTNDL